MRTWAGQPPPERASGRPRPGRLVAIEGPDGSGKTTLVQRLAEKLTVLGQDVLSLREPGGCEVSEMVRGMVKDPQLSICDRAEALLFAAARAQLVEEVIVPALDQGKMVLLDRWIDSSKVYQGLARGLGTDPVARLSEFAVNGLTADRVLVLDVSERTARARMSERDGLNGADRIEQQLSAKVVRDGYRQLTELADDVYRVISAEGTPDEVLAEAAGALSDLF